MSCASNTLEPKKEYIHKKGEKTMAYQDPWDIKRPTSNCPLCGELTICNFLCEDCSELYE